MKTMKNNRLTMISLFLCFCAAALAAYVTVYAQSSNTIQGCFDNKTGVLRKVASPNDCSQKETPISWNIVGPQGPQGNPGPQGPAGPQGPPGVGTMPLRVVDSLGNEVGLYDSGLAIRRDENLTTWISLQVSQEGFVQGGSGFGYTTSDCTGTAYVGGTTLSQLVDPVYVVGDTVYQPTGSIQTRTLNSSQNPGQPCEVGTFMQAVRPTTTYPVSSFGLTPPFTLTR